MIMKLIHKISGLALLILAVLLGAFLVAGARSSAAWTRVAGLVSGNRGLGVGIGIALLFLGVIYVLSAIPKRRRQKYLSFDAEGGTVSISTTAIAEYVARVGGEFPSIVRMKPEVIPGKNSIDIHAYVQIKDGPDIQEVCELLQKRIREVLAGSLGITEVRTVQVSVKEIIAEFRPD